MNENNSEELLEIIEQQKQRIRKLEQTLKSYGIFVPDSDKKLTGEEKIQIFMDYFRCRTDLYAQRFFSNKKQSYGWNPVCRNNFSPVCGKKKGKYNCFQCEFSSFEQVTSKVIKDHFTGNNPGIGFYPLLKDSTCWWLAIDFDDECWFEDMLSVYREASKRQMYPVMERSQSGQGGHLWFFFASPIKASIARKFAEQLIRLAMRSNPKLKFDSFDRMFPNQDFIPEGGAGNLIALPLRYDAYLKGNSAFIDTEERVIRQPIEYLASRPKITAEEVQALLNNEYDQDYFFESDQLRMSLITDVKYDRELYGEISDWLKIRKSGLGSATRNILLRCASMYNPKYFEMQRLHKPIYVNGNLPKILSYYEEDDQYLYLPKGVLPLIKEAMPEAKLNLEDHTFPGNEIDVTFTGTLRKNQEEAGREMLKHHMGIFQASAGFGKTVLAIWLISQLKVSTLILIDKKDLQNQWEKRIEEYLEYPKPKLKRDRFVNKYGSSRKKLGGKIDIAMVRTLANEENIKELVSGYGLVIVDECHHVACDSFLRVMRNITSQHIYGLSATPKRDDGLFKVITMFCGPILKRVDQSKTHSFEKILIPRYTNHRYLKDASYVDMCAELVTDQVRNYMIIKDVLNEYRNGSEIIILTERVQHVHILFDLLKHAAEDVYMLTGESQEKQREAILQTVRETEKNSILIATSTLVGEGFDLPSLNCLFLVMPIKSENRIEQYTGRTHRTVEGKDIVKVYDYVDAQIPMAQNMYYKRLKKYRKEGYYVQDQKTETEVAKILYDKNTFEEVLLKDMDQAEKEIVLFTANPRLPKIKKYFSHLQQISQRGRDIHFILSQEKEDQEIISFLEGTGGRIIANTHHKHFIVIDRKIVWNCSFDFFGNVNDESFATRNISINSAEEILNTISKDQIKENQ